MFKRSWPQYETWLLWNMLWCMKLWNLTLYRQSVHELAKDFVYGCMIYCFCDSSWTVDLLLYNYHYFIVEGLITRDDSDSSSSPSTSYKTPASVAAFVKKVKRIRFNSITIAKDLPSTGRLNIAQPVCSHATSCPDLLAAAAAECGTPSSVSSSQHHLVAGSPAVVLRRPSFADPSLLVVDRISVATQTTMYVHGAESDVVTHLTPYESLVAQTIPFAPFVQCYACLHGRRPADETKIKSGEFHFSPLLPFRLIWTHLALEILFELSVASLENAGMISDGAVGIF